MRRIHIAFLATIQLCSARARTRSFSIHEDLLAFPQFDVVFSSGSISEKDAQALLNSDAPHPTYSADFTQPTAGNHDGADGGETRSGSPLTYELINMSPHRYLCAIPDIPPPAPENQTATELAKAEEARELSRAVTSGWGLLNKLEDSCLYFFSGWWSYKFCNNREIVQFHALPSTPVGGQAPRRDPHTAEYVLGRAPAIPASSETHSQSDDDADKAKVPAELQVKGDQRYLVQRLEGGTICDLTGRERTIEVQYHCVPGLQGDRIGWIKEVTICAYVMVVNTPRLCDDVAFLPLEESKANPITCRLIADDGQTMPPLLEQTASESDTAAAAATDAKQTEDPQKQEPAEAERLTVGGVVVGARKVISGADKDGQPPAKLPPPRSYLNSYQTQEEGLVEVLIHAASKEDGGQIDALSAEELERLDLKPEVVEEMRERMLELAGDLGWQLEIVEMPGDETRELRGWVHDGGEETEEKPAGKASRNSNFKDDKGKRKKGKEDKAGSGKGSGKGNGNNNGNSNGNGQQQEGSEEKLYKDEL